MEPKKFKELGIPVPSEGFIGEKISMSRILNRPVVVHKYKIEDSKHNKGKCLYLQLTVDDVRRLLFTSSGVLIDQILKAKTEDFPFITTIVEENDRYIFT